MKIEIDGEKVEISPEQVELDQDDPFVTKEKLNDVVESRLSREKSRLPKKLKKDDEFFREAAEARGIELREDGMPKGTTTDDKLRELRKKAQKAEELEKKNQSLSQTLQKTRKKTLRSQLNAAAPDLKDDMKDVFMTYVSGDFIYDEEYDDFVQKQGEDIRFKGEKPVDVETYIDELRTKKPTFFQPKGASDGPDLSGSNGGGGQTFTFAEWEAEMSKADQLSDERYNELKKAYQDGRVIE